jgi:hypothetical protein
MAPRGIETYVVIQRMRRMMRKSVYICFYREAAKAPSKTTGCAIRLFKERGGPERKALSGPQT